MDEEKEKIKAEGVEKKNEAGEKSADDGGGIATILLKLDLHCEGCAKKVRRCVRHFEGVKDVKADSSTGKLTVKGNVDPLWLREKVEIKTKKKVALLSAQPKKVVAGSDGGGGDQKSDDKVENKAAEEKKGEDKKAQKAHQCNTEVVRLHCDGSAQKVKRFIIKELKPYLKRNVAVVPPKKGDGSGGRGDNKKKKEVARGKKKDGESTVAAASKSREPKEQKTEVINNKMEYYYGGYSNNSNMYYAMPPMYNQNYSNQDYGVTMQDHHGYYGHSTGYVPTPRDHEHGYVSPRHLTASRDHDHGYGYTGYVQASRDHDHGYGYTGYVQPPYTAPQYFSDENPNACSVM